MIRHHPPRDARGIAHHPSEYLLLAYATGASDEAMSLIVATHMALCSQCRAAVTAMEKIGGTLLETLPPTPLAGDALTEALAKLDGIAPHEKPRRVPSRDGTPDVLRSYLGGDLSTARWRRMGPKLAYLPLFRRGRTSAKLLRGVPGTEVGAHSHRGLEFTLVLAGGFTDVTGSYGPGDLQVADAELRHNPIADPGEDCINLAVTTAPLKFENLLQKIAGPLFGF
jgi:putative transcriptional regulator